ncbi:hypothetical protein EWM62_15900 [Mucilaginibacter terrigena]|uniref:Uncharacterized protein n=1 Tax=Mucilaginibacter terrigena TaxID=2492395 RepID=A0A4Q5LKI9_9SPHI|nr:hypothetical protein [Mucilaginibacter terrigena]RYU87974.1 hypothetical protein EWM62_15900 [Mucilaginibacter terrigena]
MNNAADNIPVQTEGEKTDIIQFADCANVPDAHHLFLLAKDRLKDISQWHVLSGPHSAKFAITDAAGNEVYKMAEKGDLFYINLPAPGPMAGDGKEWVRIEAIQELEDADAESEYITMTVRPVANPRHPDKATAHFFSHNSTSTFIVERYQNHVSAAVHGRNETPNNKDTGLYDTVRNTIIALAAREGLSVPQWKSLVTGILQNNS